MLKLIAILTATCLALTATAQAKEKPSRQAAPKAKAPQQQKQPAAPKSRPAQIQKQQQTNVGPDVHNNVRKQKELRKSPTVESKKAPDVKPEQLSTDTKSKKPAKVETKELTAPKTNEPATARTTKKAPLPKERIEQIRAQHKDFKAKPSQSIASVQFNQNYQISGSENWSGPQYQAFRSYRPQWHDRDWWQSRYGASILLIGGGWYYWDAGYWYPAWGYDESAAYYPYDGPIYVGDNRLPFDQIVADVQATLQEQGYYKGEVDGLMGPLTRQALADFQRDNGLISTAALDEPTLSTLGLG